MELKYQNKEIYSIDSYDKLCDFFIEINFFVLDNVWLEIEDVTWLKLNTRRHQVT